MFDMKKHLEDFEKEILDILNDTYKPVSKAQSLENEIVMNKICSAHGRYEKKLIESFRDTLYDIVPKKNEESA